MLTNYKKNYSFNTSYVSVQAGDQLEFKESESVSIHPMFRFKLELLEDDLELLELFQYILCFGSSTPSYILERLSQEFQYILCFGSSNIKLV